MWIPRGNVDSEHVKFETLYCGICHTDCHSGHNHFGMTKFPYVSGHEIVGKVTEVGKNVTFFKTGDIIGVGRFVDSCLNCPECNRGEEQYCSNTFTTTDGGVRKHGRVPSPNSKLPTYGGYSASNVVHEKYVLKIPKSIPQESAGPILCAGVTMYNPLKRWGAVQAANEGRKLTVGIIGIGGLGTMGIKLAKAMKHNVIAVSHSA